MKEVRGRRLLRPLVLPQNPSAHHKGIFQTPLSKVREHLTPVSFPYCDGEGVAEVTHVVGSPGRVRTTGELQRPVFTWTAVVMGPFAISLVTWVHACQHMRQNIAFQSFSTSETSEIY